MKQWNSIKDAVKDLSEAGMLKYVNDQEKQRTWRKQSQMRRQALISQAMREFKQRQSA